MKKFFLVLMSIALLATACSEDGATTEQPGNGKDKLYSINGAIQKGPFVQGSNILIQTLNEKLNPIGQSYTTSTINNAGMFEMADVNSKYIEVIATGYYFDEVTGELSSGPLTLRSINELTDGVTTNVNILTSLTYNRIKNLVSKQGLSIVDANHQAEQELYDALKIPENMRPNVSCDKMDIANSGDGNGFLLAVSAVLQRGRTVAELTEYISKFSADLADDGIVGDETIEKFNSNALPTMDFESTIKENIKKRYDSLGVDYTIPDFEKYISSLPQGKQYCIIPFTYKDEYDDVNMGQFDFKTDVKFLGKSYKDGKGEIYLSASPTIVYGPTYPFISSIVIPDSVTEIGEGAFACNYLLTDITLGNSLAIIGMEAFASCTSLASITIPASVTEIGEYAFMDVYISKENFINNSSLDAEAANYWGAQLFDAVTEDGLCINGTTIITCKNSATSVTIPDSVTAIGDGAFGNCLGLTTITIPNSVTTIGGGAFSNCI